MAGIELDASDYDKHALYDPTFFDTYKDHISDKYFNLCYTYDRKLFHRLINKLGRDVGESMLVVAFLIWLERILYSKSAVYTVITWQFPFVNQLANDIAAFVSCLKSDTLLEQFINLNLLKTLCSRHIDLYLFREKRIRILRSIYDIVDEVCVRAFKDILAPNSKFVDSEGDRMWYNYINPTFVPPPFRPDVAIGFSELGFCRNLNFPPPEFHRPMETQYFTPIIGPQYIRPTGPEYFMPVGPQNFGPMVSQNFGPMGSQDFRPSIKLWNILEDPNADLSELVGGMNLVDGSEDEPDVPADDRTIFLTFSKGYHIPESEVREFFTGLFGDFIERLYMQDVTSDEQPLYARMVCRSSKIIRVIAPGPDKSTYSIKGRHIMAKKDKKGTDKESNSSATASTSKQPKSEN